jgi:primosomal protein N' (replication factor Y)
VRTAAAHDYAAFYAIETGYRRRLHYPPFSSLACLTYAYRNDDSCRREAEKMKRFLSEMLAAEGNDGISIIGPAPAFVHRLRGSYRWQIVLRGTGLPAFLARVPLSRGWTADVDPVGL